MAEQEQNLPEWAEAFVATVESLNRNQLDALTDTFTAQFGDLTETATDADKEVMNRNLEEQKYEPLVQQCVKVSLKNERLKALMTEADVTEEEMKTELMPTLVRLTRDVLIPTLQTPPEVQELQARIQDMLTTDNIRFNDLGRPTQNEEEDP